MQPSFKQAGRRRSTLWGILAVIALLLVAIFAAPWMNVSRFRRGIERSISQGIGRPAQIGSVSFQLFPQPAFVLSHVSIAEDPAFGAEPVMSADTVTATLRISSLLRGRVGVATLSLENPSLNLVRNASGQWDFNSVLQRTGSSHVVSPDKFPYVEATGARVNFKLNNEKQPFSLMDADLAVWRESAGSWHLRLKAQPVRTDLDLNDTGELRGEAVLRSATALGLTPVTAHVEWRKAPLGEISRLLQGRDTGWRGMVNVTADLGGTLDAMNLATNMDVEGFRRVEVVPVGEMDAHILCSAQYEHALEQLSFITCSAPLDRGEVRLTGNFSLHPTLHPSLHSQAVAASGAAAPSLQVLIQKVPANFVLQLLRHIHAGIPAEASATGELNGQLQCGEISGDSGNPCTGAFHATRWTLALPGVARPFVFPPLDLVRADGANFTKPTAKVLRNRQHLRKETTLPQGFILEPVHLSLGAATPVTITGALTQQGYSMAVTGTAAMDDLLPLARALGGRAFPSGIQSVQGHALLGLVLQGRWLPAQNDAAETALAPALTPAAWQGTIQLQKAKIALANWPGTIQVSSATVQLNPENVSWEKVHGSFQKENFDGSLHYATSTGTTPSSPCVFHLHAEELNPSHVLTDVLAEGARSSRWLEVVQRWMGNIPSLPACTGTIQVDRFSLGALPVNHAALTLQVEGQQATASSISGNMLGGTLQGGGSVHWTTGVPAYQGQIVLRGIQPNAVAALTQSRAWGNGSVDVHLDLTSQGFTARDLAAHAAGNLTAQWKLGGWNAPEFSATPLAKFQRISLQGTIRNQTVRITDGALLAPPLHGFVTGTVAFSGGVNLYVQPTELQIQGTLAHPVVSLHSQKVAEKTAKE